jgi:hypothetical protein
MTSDDIAITVRRVDDHNYSLEMSHDSWVASTSTLNQLVNGSRVADYELEVGASRHILKSAMSSLDGWTTAVSGLRAWVMSLAEERALEAALVALATGDWIRPTEFHPLIGVQRASVLDLTSRLRSLRTLADEDFGN